MFGELMTIFYEMYLILFIQANGRCPPDFKKLINDTEKYIKMIYENRFIIHFRLIMSIL